jgi:hypothetical protein
MDKTNICKILKNKNIYQYINSMSGSFPFLEPVKLNYHYNKQDTQSRHIVLYLPLSVCDWHVFAASVFSDMIISLAVLSWPQCPLRLCHLVAACECSLTSFDGVQHFFSRSCVISFWRWNWISIDNICDKVLELSNFTGGYSECFLSFKICTMILLCIVLYVQWSLDYPWPFFPRKLIICSL